MDEVLLDGKKYLSARKAAKDHGYASDYIGQLIRGGKLQGRKVGRAWFVAVDSLDAFVGAPASEKPATKSQVAAVVHEERKVPLKTTHLPPAVEPRKIVSQTVSRYPLLTYLTDEEEDFPSLKKETPVLKAVERTSEDDFQTDEPLLLPQPAGIGLGTAYGAALFTGAVTVLLLSVSFLALSERHISYDARSDSAATSFSIQLFR